MNNCRDLKKFFCSMLLSLHVVIVYDQFTEYTKVMVRSQTSL